MKVRFNGSAGELFWIWLGWSILMLCTLGLATPFFYKRLGRYFADNMEIVEERVIASGR